MTTLTSSLISLLCALIPSTCSLNSQSSSYQVILDYGTFQGSTNILTGVDSYLGIPFAHAPRFDHAYLYNSSDPFTEVQDATAYGPICPQQELVSLVSDVSPEIAGILGFAEGLFAQDLKQSEDCLSINVQIPTGTETDAELPVVMWIHGGGYTFGGSAVFAGETSAAPVFYHGANIVARSIEMDQPIIFVSANYRLNAFGVSGGKEILDAGVANLAIEDQRLAMKWIQEHISKFGGSPDKVTIWGESAGAWSVSTHMVLNDGDNEGLFRGAVAFSGGPMKVDYMDRQQDVFDDMAASTGCDSSSDILDCLRNVDFDAIYAAVQEQPIFIGYQSLAIPWLPRPDGILLKDSPHRLAASGKIANVPMIIGDMKDEGTLFSLFNQLNVTTDAEFKDYFQRYWWPNATDAEMENLMNLYPSDPSAGSPFDTGDLNALTPQYKRLAALIGDYSFQSQRRQMLNVTATRNNTWTYEIDISIPILDEILDDIPVVQSLDLSAIPALGSFHCGDAILYAFGLVPSILSRNTLDIMSTFISFVATLDPNNHGLEDIPDWPVWGEGKQQLRFQESGADLIEDTYREEAMWFINDHADSLLV